MGATSSVKRQQAIRSFTEGVARDLLLSQVPVCYLSVDGYVTMQVTQLVKLNTSLVSSLRRSVLTMQTIKMLTFDLACLVSRQVLTRVKQIRSLKAKHVC